MHPLVTNLLARPRVLQHTPEWYNARSGRITASDVPAILGHNKYCTAEEVFRRKTYQTTNKFNAVACAHGHRYEAVAAKAYTAVTGIECVAEDIGLVLHPTFEYFGASPDGVAKEHPILVEIKCPYRRKIEAGVIPPHYIDQLEFQMAVTCLPIVHFVQFQPATLTTRGVLDITEKAADPTWCERNFPKLHDFYTRMTAFNDTHPTNRRLVRQRCLTVQRDGSHTISEEPLQSTVQQQQQGPPNNEPVIAEFDPDRYDISLQKMAAK